MDQNWISILALVIAIIAVGFGLTRGKLPLTVEGVNTAIKVVPGIASEINAAANVVVLGIEQIRREGNLSNEDAYNMALNQMRDWVRLVVPGEIKITNEQIISAINSAILVASALTHQIEESKTVVAELEAPESVTGTLDFTTALRN